MLRVCNVWPSGSLYSLRITTSSNNAPSNNGQLDKNAKKHQKTSLIDMEDDSGPFKSTTKPIIQDDEKEQKTDSVDEEEEVLLEVPILSSGQTTSCTLPNTNSSMAKIACQQGGRFLLTFKTGFASHDSSHSFPFQVLLPHHGH